MMPTTFGNDAAIWQNEIKKAFAPFAEMQKQLADSFEPIRKVLEEQQAIWAAQQETWAKYSQEIAEGIKRFETALEKAEAIGRYGWMIPLDATPRETVHIIDSITDEASADAAYLAYFTSFDGYHLNVLIEKTVVNPMLQHWKPWLEEAAFCLREKKYRVCISSLLPILDGLCARQFALPQFQSKSRRQRFLDDRRQQVANSSSIVRFEWLAFIGFVETVFSDLDFSNPTPQPAVLNRHLILHGRDIPQAKLEDCLRLLLALDTISALEP